MMMYPMFSKSFAAMKNNRAYDSNEICLMPSPPVCLEPQHEKLAQRMLHAPAYSSNDDSGATATV